MLVAIGAIGSLVPAVSEMGMSTPAKASVPKASPRAGAIANTALMRASRYESPERAMDAIVAGEKLAGFTGPSGRRFISGGWQMASAAGDAQKSWNRLRSVRAP